MIANVFAVLAIATVAAAQCGGLVNTGFSGSSCGSNAVLVSQGVNTCNGNLFGNNVLSQGINNGNCNGNLFGNSLVGSQGVNGLNGNFFGNSLIGTESCRSSSFGNVFPADTRSVGFVSPRPIFFGCAPSANNGFTKCNQVVSSTCTGSLAANPTQVSADSPVVSTGCGNQLVGQVSGLSSNTCNSGLSLPVVMNSGSSCGNGNLFGNNVLSQGVSGSSCGACNTGLSVPVLVNHGVSSGSSCGNGNLFGNSVVSQGINNGNLFGNSVVGSGIVSGCGY